MRNGLYIKASGETAVDCHKAYEMEKVRSRLNLNSVIAFPVAENHSGCIDHFHFGDLILGMSGENCTKIKI